MTYKPFFRKTIRPGIGSIVSSEFGRVAFASLSLERALALWEKGFPYLAITPDGARKLFGDMPVAERTELLKMCRTPEEVAAIVNITRYAPKPLQLAAEKRLKELEPAQG